MHFEKVPSSDAILMKWIVKCWGDDHCAKLISVECILPMNPDATNSAQGLIGVDVCLLAYANF
jgi:hypothetical protein